MVALINGPILTNENTPYYYVYAPYDAESSLIEVQGNIQEVEKNHGRSSLAYVGLTGTVIFIIYYLLISIMSPMLIVVFTAILGALALFLGFRYFSRHLITANIPVSKIFAAPIGLGIFDVKFAPENGQPLISPLTKTPCVLYSVAIIHQVNNRYNYNTNNIISYVKRGTHSILTDETGYIVMQLANSIGYVEGLYKVYHLHIRLLDDAVHVFSSPKELQPLKEAIDNARNNNTDIDLTNLISNLKVSATEQKVGIPLKGFHRNGYYLVEYTIPVNKDYTAIGFLDHTEKKLNNKPVSKLVKDPQTKLLDLRYGPEKIVTHKYDKKAYAMFAMAMIAFIAAYLVGSYHNFYGCLGIIENNQIISCQYINGTEVVIYRPQAQPASPVTISYTTIAASGAATTIPSSTTASSTTITIPSSTSANFSSCDNFSIVDQYLSNETYGVCSWDGGRLNVSVAGGDSGFAGVKIIGEHDNKTYFSTGTNVRCLTNLGSFYAPAQQYKVELSTGRGYGACGADIVYLSSS